MKPSTRFGIVAIIVCIVGIGLTYELNKPGPPASELINQQLVTAVTAANAGSAQQLMSVISDNYKDSGGETRGEVGAIVTKGFQEDHDLRFRISTPQIAVTGDKASSDFVLSMLDASSGTERANRSVHVDWQRERANKWIFFHQDRWMAVSSDLSPESVLDQ